MDTQQKTLDWGMQYERNRRATSALREYLVALAHHQQTMIDSREPTLKPWDIRRTINGGRTQEACPLSTAGLTIFNGQRNYQIPLPCTNRYCHSCRDTERKNIMARTLYALEDQKLINKPFYMLTLTVSGSWRSMRIVTNGNRELNTVTALQLTMLNPSYFGFAKNNKIAIRVGKSGRPLRKSFETSTLWNIPASQVAATDYRAMCPSLKGFLGTLKSALAKQLSQLDLDTSCPYISRPYWEGGSSGCSSDYSEHTGSRLISEVPSSHGDKCRIYTLYCGAIRYLHDDDCVVGGKKSPALIGKWTSLLRADNIAATTLATQRKLSGMS